MRKPPAVLNAWHGLGDTIYLRPSLKPLSERYLLYVSTSWPELLDDLDVQFVRPSTHLRTQAENVVRQGRGRWAQTPRNATRLEPKVLWSTPMGIPHSMAHSLGLDVHTLDFDLPRFSRPEIDGLEPGEPYAVVRPVTVRTEWENPARNCDPRYVAAAAAALQDRGLKVVSVAHLEPGKEWALDPLPPADVVLHRGELGVSELLGLTQEAAIVVGAVGWIVPAMPAQRTPCLVIGGGNGFHNAPERIVCPPMDGSRIRFILPDEYCRWCHDQKHECPKEIKGFPFRLEQALGELLV